MQKGLRSAFHHHTSQRTNVSLTNTLLQYPPLPLRRDVLRTNQRRCTKAMLSQGSRHPQSANLDKNIHSARTSYRDLLSTYDTVICDYNYHL